MSEEEAFGARFVGEAWLDKRLNSSSEALAQTFVEEGRRRAREQGRGVDPGDLLFELVNLLDG